MLGDMKFISDLGAGIGRGIAENAGQAAATAITAFGDQATRVILASRLPRSQLNDRFGAASGQFGSGFGFGSEKLTVVLGLTTILAVGYLVYDKRKKKD